MYIKLTENNSWERETWNYYIKYNNQNSSVKNLVNGIKKHKLNNYEISTLTQEQFIKINQSNNNTSYKSTHNVFSNIPNLNFSDKELLEDVLYKGKIFEYTYYRVGKEYSDSHFVYDWKSIFKLLDIEFNNMFLTTKQVEKILSNWNNHVQLFQKNVAKFRQKIDSYPKEYNNLRKEYSQKMLFEADVYILERMLKMAKQKKMRLYIYSPEK